MLESKGILLLFTGRSILVVWVQMAWHLKITLAAKVFETLALITIFVWKLILVAAIERVLFSKPVQLKQNVTRLRTIRACMVYRERLLQSNGTKREDLVRDKVGLISIRYNKRC